MFRQSFAHLQERKTANYGMWYGVLLYWWVGGQDSGNPLIQQDTIPHAVICSLTLLKMDKSLPETC
jgi:hypothetical protein